MNYYILGKSSGYLKEPRICSWPHCERLIYTVRTRYCDKHRPLYIKEQKKLWKEKNWKKVLDSSKKYWKTKGKLTREKLYKKYPAKKLKHNIYCKKYQKDHMHKCKCCNKLVSPRATYCLKHSDMYIKRGFVRKFNN